MILRDVGCTLYAAWIGGLAGMVVMLPAAVVLINVSGPAVISAPFIGGVSGFLAGVLAVADKPGARRGSGAWLGVAVGLLAMALCHWNGSTDSPFGVPVAPTDWAGLVAGFAILAGVGFVTGRVGERGARWSAGTA